MVASAIPSFEPCQVRTRSWWSAAAALPPALFVVLMAMSGGLVVLIAAGKGGGGSLWRRWRHRGFVPGCSVWMRWRRGRQTPAPVPPVIKLGGGALTCDITPEPGRAAAGRPVSAGGPAGWLQRLSRADRAPSAGEPCRTHQSARSQSAWLVVAGTCFSYAVHWFGCEETRSSTEGRG